VSYEQARRVVKLAKSIARLERRQERALVALFPIGTTVRCYLMHGQVNPSIGDVIAHKAGSTPYLRVRLRSTARKVRDVPAEDVW
jgi:hypothetical protein